MRHLTLALCLLGLAAPASFAQGGGAGKVQMQDLHFGLSTKLQAALESGDHDQAKSLVRGGGGSAAGSRTSGAIATNPGSNEYTCNLKTCECSGALDCVTMISSHRVCKSDKPIACDEKGCTCTPK